MPQRIQSLLLPSHDVIVAKVIQRRGRLLRAHWRRRRLHSPDSADQYALWALYDPRSPCFWVWRCRHAPDPAVMVVMVVVVVVVPLQWRRRRRALDAL